VKRRTMFVMLSLIIMASMVLAACAPAATPTAAPPATSAPPAAAPTEAAPPPTEVMVAEPLVLDTPPAPRFHIGLDHRGHGRQDSGTLQGRQCRRTDTPRAPATTYRRQERCVPSASKREENATQLPSPGPLPAPRPVRGGVVGSPPRCPRRDARCSRWNGMKRLVRQPNERHRTPG